MALELIREILSLYVVLQLKKKSCCCKRKGMFLKTCWPKDNNPILQAPSALSGARFIPVPSSQVLMNNRSPERRGGRSCGGLS